MELNRKTYIRYADSPSSINTEGEYTEISEGIEEGSMQLSRILLQGNLKLGEANSSRFQVQIYGISNITGKFIQVRQQDSGKDPIYLFSGFVESAKLDASRAYRSITAYDALYYYLDLDITNLWETFWGTEIYKNLQGIYRVIYDFYGFVTDDVNDPAIHIPYQSSRTIDKTKINMTGAKLSDLLRMLGEINAAVWYVDGYNRLICKNLYKTSELNITANVASTSTFEEYEVKPVTQIKAYLSESSAAEKTLKNASPDTDLSDMETNGLIGYSTPVEGDNNNIMIITDNYILASWTTDTINTVLNGVQAVMPSASWTPCTLNLIFNENVVEPGRYLRVTAKDYANNSFTFTTFALQFNYSGAGLSDCTISAAGNQYLDNDKSPYSSGTQAVVNASARVLKELRANVITVDYLNANYITAEKARLEFASIKSLEVEDGKFKNLQVNYLTADSADLKYAKVTDLEVVNGKFTNLDVKYVTADMADINQAGIEKIFAESGIIKDLTMGDAGITGKLTAVTIDASSITAGTLAVDRLIIKGSNNSVMYKLNENGDIDKSTVSNTDLQNLLHGQNIIANTITATQIKAGTITATQIDTNNISAAIAKIITLDASKITSGYLDSARIKANSITAEQIDTSTLTADMIKSGVLKSTSGDTQFNLDDGYIQCVAQDSSNNLIVTSGSLEWRNGTSTISPANAYIKYSENKGRLTVHASELLLAATDPNLQIHTMVLTHYNRLEVEVATTCYQPLTLNDIDGDFSGNTGCIYRRYENLNDIPQFFKQYTGMSQYWYEGYSFTPYNNRAEYTKTIENHVYWYSPLSHKGVSNTAQILLKDYKMPSSWTTLKLSARIRTYGHCTFQIAYKTASDTGYRLLPGASYEHTVTSDNPDTGTSETFMNISYTRASNITTVYSIGVVVIPDTESDEYWAAWRDPKLYVDGNIKIGNEYTMAGYLGVDTDEGKCMVKLHIFDNLSGSSLRMQNSYETSGILSFTKEDLIWKGLGGVYAKTFISELNTMSQPEETSEEITTNSVTSNITSPSVIGLFDENKSSICAYKITNSTQTTDSNVTTEGTGQGTITENGEFIENSTLDTEFGFIKDGTHPIPKEVMSPNGEGINLYSMASINWKATQELLTIIENLKARVSELEGKNETSTNM